MHKMVYKVLFEEFFKNIYCPIENFPDQQIVYEKNKHPLKKSLPATLAQDQIVFLTLTVRKKCSS